MDKTDRLRDYGLAFLLYEHGLGICGYELIRELFIFIKLILNSYLYIIYKYIIYKIFFTPFLPSENKTVIVIVSLFARYTEPSSHRMSMLFNQENYVSSSPKLRVSFINQIQNQSLLKIEPYRHPKFGGIMKKPYLCTVIQKKGACWPVKGAMGFFRGFCRWQREQ